MPRKRYRVVITEHAEYECFVSAPSKSAARDAAEAMFLSSTGISVGPPFTVEVVDRDVFAETFSEARIKVEKAN